MFGRLHQGELPVRFEPKSVLHYTGKDMPDEPRSQGSELGDSQAQTRAELMQLKRLKDFTMLLPAIDHIFCSISVLLTFLSASQMWQDLACRQEQQRGGSSGV